MAALMPGQGIGAVAWPVERAVERGADGGYPAAYGAGAGHDGARHPGKSHRVLREGAAVKYAWIEKNKLRWPVYVQCRVSVAGGVFASSPPTATMRCRLHRTCWRVTSWGLRRTPSGPTI